MKTLQMIAGILIIIGAINWGFVGFFNFDLVTTIFQAGSTLTTLVYDIIGLAGVYALFWMLPKMK